MLSLKAELNGNRKIFFHPQFFLAPLDNLLYLFIIYAILYWLDYLLARVSQFYICAGIEKKTRQEFENGGKICLTILLNAGC